jgi:hypothetical protein
VERGHTYVHSSPPLLSLQANAPLERVMKKNKFGANNTPVAKKKATTSEFMGE